jgi:hypothetical protein
MLNKFRILSMTANTLQVVITIMKTTLSSSKGKCFKLRLTNKDSILFRRWVLNVRLMTEQIQRHNVTQKLLANFQRNCVQFWLPQLHVFTYEKLGTAVRTFKIPHFVSFPAQFLLEFFNSWCTYSSW